MSTIAEWVERAKGLDLERTLGLRPNWPGVVVSLDGPELTTVRLKSKRRGPATLEAHDLVELEGSAVPSTIFDQNGMPGPTLAEALRRGFEAVGARPGRASLVLPDNLAKVSMLQLPERPPSRKQLLEIIRFKMHRAVPFRFSEARLSYQVIPHSGPGMTVLVALMRSSLVERYEQVFEAVGAKAGLIDLCTPSLLNLVRGRVDAAATDGDVALLNCTANYFSLIIVRDGQLIFFRNKNYRLGEQAVETASGMLAREIANSFSYYEEKLSGTGVGAMLVRSVTTPLDELREILGGMGVDQVEPIDPLGEVELGEGVTVSPEAGQRVAPAIGAAVGRN